MGEHTSISWTDHTFNIWWGCEHASRDDPRGVDADPAATSPECANCYAESFDHRIAGAHWGPSAEPRWFGPLYWAKPLAWNAAAEKAGKRASVFCSSMADWAQLHRVPQINARMNDERAKMWRLINVTPWLDWLLLTKRADRLTELLPWHGGRYMDHGKLVEVAKPWPNVWVGVTCGVRSSLWRIAELRKISAAARFVSCEPLLEHITAEDWDRALDSRVREVRNARLIDWLIVGDESGPDSGDHARRPAQADWVRTAREAALRHNVIFHFKQWNGQTSSSLHAAKGDGEKTGSSRKIHLPVLDGRRWSGRPNRRGPHL